MAGASSICSFQSRLGKPGDYASVYDRVVTRFVLLMSVLVAGCASRQTGPADVAPATNAPLAARIEQLVEQFLMVDEETRITAALADARLIFEREGIPGTAQVGDAAAYGFVLINMLGQPPDVRLRFLDRVQEAAARGALPADALPFAQARRRHTEIENRYRGHVPSHPQLRDQIAQLYKDDQAVRQKEGFDPAEMAAADRRHAGPLQSIFDRYGVPTYDMVGIQATHDFIVMVQHQPPALRAAVLPKLKASVDAGQGDPATYAMVYDRTQRDQGRNQWYGQQLECVGNALEVAPIDDAANVNLRRADLGLMRLELYVRLVRQQSPDVCGSKV